MAKIDTLIDNFNDNTLSASWDDFAAGNATIAEQNQRIEIALPATADNTADGDISTPTTYDLADSHAQIEVIEVPSAATNANGELRVFTDADNWFRFVYEQGRLFAQYKKAGVVTEVSELTYDASAHRFWKIEEESGVVSWYTSSDGQNWDLHGEFTHAMTISAMKILIAAICYKDETDPGNFIIDNFNLVPLARLQDNFNDNALDIDRWTEFEGGSATVTEVNKRLQIAYPASSTSSTDGDILSNNTFDLSESSVHAEVLSVPSNATDADAEIRVTTDSNNWFRIIKESSSLFFQRRKAGASATIASIAYSATNHKWWRIRESGGTIYYETSPTGKAGSWTQQATYTHGMTITAMKLLVAGTCFKNESNPGNFIVDNINTGTLELRNSPIRLKQNHVYRLSFKVRSTTEQTVGVKVSNSQLLTDFLDTDVFVRQNVTEGKSLDFTASANDDNAVLRIIPERAFPSALYVDNFKLIDLTVERKEYRVMRIKGSLLPGSFIQTLTLREKTDQETA